MWVGLSIIKSCSTFLILPSFPYPFIFYFILFYF
jgi:hypothetical protein